MLAAFSDANLACISHATRFVSTAALVRIGLDHLSQKTEKKNRKKPKKNRKKPKKNRKKPKKNRKKPRKNRIKPKKNKLLIVAAQGGAEGLSH